MMLLDRMRQSKSPILGTVALLVVIAYGAISFYGMNTLSSTSKWVEHTYQVINAAESIEKNILNLETGQRGYLITGKENFLEPYQQGQQALTNLLRDTKNLVSDNPEQIARLEQLEQLLQNWYRLAAEPEIAERRKVNQGNVNSDHLQELVAEEVGKKIVDQIRVELEYMDLAFTKADNNIARLYILAIAKHMLDMETGERGFLLSGKDNFLAPFEDGINNASKSIDQLHQLLNNSYNLQLMNSNINELQEIVSQWRHQIITPQLAQNATNNQASKQQLLSQLNNYNNRQLSEKLFKQLATIEQQFAHSAQLLGQNTMLSIHQLITEQENSAKGFLLTGSPSYLADLKQSQANFDQELSLLKQLVANNVDVNQARRSLNKVELLIKDWINTVANPYIEIRQKINQNPSSFKQLITLIERETGKAIVDDMRALLAKFKQVEHDLMVTRKASADVTSDFTMSVMLFGTLAIAGFAIVIMRASNTLKAKSYELQSERNKLEQQNWVKSNFSETVAKLQGLKELKAFAETMLLELVPRLNSHLGLFYITTTDEDNEQSLSLQGSYAYDTRKSLTNHFTFGEGLVGQCALEQKQILLTRAPKDYIEISSGSGSSEPHNIIVFPLLFEDKVLAVVEIASVAEFTEQHQELIEQIAHNCGVIFNNISAQILTQELLSESQAQSEELQAQQEELRVANNNLEEQTSRLKASEQNLQQQSEELRVANEELEEKQELQQKQNQELELAKQEVDRKAADLTKASKYKSDFLANMSHELRTPLNSLLILSKNLAKNKQGNLTDDQVEDASVIYEGGNSLLTLINDIMDLSKVEAGMLQISKEPVPIDSITTNIERLFSGTATEKNLNFVIERQQDLPASLITDGLRLEQIIKNFLSNAFKFTESGSVTLKIYTPDNNDTIKNSTLAARKVIAISVVDTGIGIPKEKQKLIFEAFQQEDGSTTRKYGGTGLGLTISRELASLLGGEISLSSEPGQGCNVTLYLPLSEEDKLAPAQAATSSVPLATNIEQQTFISDNTPTANAANQLDSTVVHENFINDDRRTVHQGDPCVLVIEDDKNFAKILRDIVHEDNYKCLITDKGREGIYLAKEYKPHGILLDMGLPDIDGIHVLEQLKFNLITRHIPVHVISGTSRKQQSLEHGAYSFIEKPAQTDDIKTALAQFTTNGDSNCKQVLVVEDDKNTQHAIERLLDVPDIELIFVATGDEVIEQLNQTRFDCIILDLGLPDISGMEVLDQINQLTKDKPPVIVYTGQEISDEDQMILGRYADDIIIKGVESPERLLDDVTLFLHSVGKNLPLEQKQTIQMLHNEDEMLNGRRILLVDDDMRNVFAMSRQLTDAGLDIVMAENGQKAIDALNASDKPFELVLMDIMMPVMDGYEAMRKIRKMPTYRDIPIIALTAKAMTEDRHKCFEAGASEYITKPVDMEKLLSILGVWLYKHKANNG